MGERATAGPRLRQGWQKEKQEQKQKPMEKHVLGFARYDRKKSGIAGMWRSRK
jgi:hypothetical protein